MAAVLLACACAPSAQAAGAAPAVDQAGEPIPVSSASVHRDSVVAVSADATAALAQNAAVGVSSFSRQNKGTNKLFENAYYGYRWPVEAASSLAAVVSSDYLIVHVPADAERDLGVDVRDPSVQASILDALVALDAAAANGGQTIADFNQTVLFTDAPVVQVGEYTYRFGVEVEPGYFYSTSTREGSEDGSGGGVYAFSGTLTAAADTVIVEGASGFTALSDFFSRLDWSPLAVSLKTTGVAIVVIFILGLLAAWGTVRVSDRWKGIMDTVFTIPMVLPPTVCGFLLLMLFGNSTWIGRELIAHGIDIVFTWPAAVISCIVVGFPLLYRTARGAFENLDANMLDAARTLGWGEGRIFLRLMMPLAWPSIAAGTVLGFARAMGEFGCTLFFAGNFAGVTKTIPIAIYFDWMAGQPDVALFWVIVVIVISFIVILFINVYSSRTQRYKRRLGDGK